MIACAILSTRWRFRNRVAFPPLLRSTQSSMKGNGQLEVRDALMPGIADRMSERHDIDIHFRMLHRRLDRALDPRRRDGGSSWTGLEQRPESPSQIPWPWTDRGENPRGHRSSCRAPEQLQFTRRREDFIAVDFPRYHIALRFNGQGEESICEGVTHETAVR